MIDDLSPAMLEQWYPALLSSELHDKPVPAKLFGQQIVLFRTSNGVHAFKDLCIHRGVPLSLGKVENDELVCAYHGWRYNGCGNCVRIPSLPADRAIPDKAKASAYACFEQHGLVWICLGTPKADVPSFFANMDEELKIVLMGPYELAAAGPRIVENFLDVSHLMFVHEGLLGDSQFPEIQDYRVNEYNGVLRTDEIVVFQPDADGRGTSMNSHYTYEVYGPFTAALIKRNPDNGEMFHLFLMVLPMTEQKSRAYMLKARNYDKDAPDDAFIAFQDTLIEQDRVMVENQKPELLPLDLQAELHLKCDRMSIAYRQRLKQWGVTFGTA
ncbi:aromatic ring-hydroxylating oxygenase subunit alpha [Cohnella luojiensis]|uniref:Aromatic ring-hydroxylating dioxygenase subunit alpha n=1 Tax=Cohnella luojiensis TaxID=652876 RepID=A0A4Y8LQA2_9BACL|nr:aromatic ring-hydroxylating dioxygenase subunit alpha [Cohnella luojiensis]TFE23538.1 aromatic ring-hydroxylating dioxygenase subunit alpha [Cohnella luojiensis]